MSLIDTGCGSTGDHGHVHLKSDTPAPDLVPEIYTTHQLAKKLPSTTDTLKRHAKVSAAQRAQGKLSRHFRSGEPNFHIAANDGGSYYN
jgi:hypothetical protein